MEANTGNNGVIEQNTVLKVEILWRAVDGTLVPILAPKDNGVAFICRKGYHAINVMAVCDHEMRFTDIVARWPGSQHDAAVCLHRSGGALQYTPTKCCKIVVACVKLHNFCIENNVPFPADMMMDNDNDNAQAACQIAQQNEQGQTMRTLHMTVMATCQVLFTLMSDLIQFPGTMHAMKEVAEASSINRIGFASIFLLVVCKSILNFLDVFTGWPKSVHDARVFRNSTIREKIHNLPEEFHVLGDSAYPLSKHVFVPYRDNGHLNNTKKKFYKCHSSTRVDVERSIVSSYCVILNFILDHEHDFDIDKDPADDGVEEQAYNGQFNLTEMIKYITVIQFYRNAVMNRSKYS
ncbi:hypothetical protein MAR_021750 [Mya arenaria]|uniref:DDE Tnp4 domain-containing protein n=1 Tax=Mya arenaria TaxID=6604 RepID=A0ABY7EBW6_MYAAR|nr:hypothetical protein MAR_021750 [Mya arenaria]